MKSVEGVIQEEVEHREDLLASPLRSHVAYSVDRRECHPIQDPLVACHFSIYLPWRPFLNRIPAKLTDPVEWAERSNCTISVTWKEQNLESCFFELRINPVWPINCICILHSATAAFPGRRVGRNIHGLSHISIIHEMSHASIIGACKTWVVFEFLLLLLLLSEIRSEETPRSVVIMRHMCSVLFRLAIYKGSVHFIDTFRRDVALTVDIVNIDMLG